MQVVGWLCHLELQTEIPTCLLPGRGWPHFLAHGLSVFKAGHGTSKYFEPFASNLTSSSPLFSHHLPVGLRGGGFGAPKWNRILQASERGSQVRAIIWKEGRRTCWEILGRRLQRKMYHLPGKKWERWFCQLPEQPEARDQCGLGT